MKGWWREVSIAVAAGRLEIICSIELIDEVIDVSHRPRISKLIPHEDSVELVDLLRRSTIVPAGPLLPVCRDPSDDYLLSLSKSSRADVLVTRDQDFLILRRYEVTEITHVAEFLKCLSTIEGTER